MSAAVIQKKTWYWPICVYNLYNRKNPGDQNAKRQQAAIGIHQTANAHAKRRLGLTPSVFKEWSDAKSVTTQVQVSWKPASVSPQKDKCAKWKGKCSNVLWPFGFPSHSCPSSCIQCAEADREKMKSCEVAHVLICVWPSDRLNLKKSTASSYFPQFLGFSNTMGFNMFNSKLRTATRFSIAVFPLFPVLKIREFLKFSVQSHPKVPLNCEVSEPNNPLEKAGSLSKTIQRKKVCPKVTCPIFVAQNQFRVIWVVLKKIKLTHDLIFGISGNPKWIEPPKKKCSQNQLWVRTNYFAKHFATRKATCLNWRISETSNFVVTRTEINIETKNNGFDLFFQKSLFGVHRFQGDFWNQQIHPFP